MMYRKLVRLILLLSLMLSGCAAAEETSPPAPAETSPPAPQTPRKLTVMTHDSFAATDEVIQQFEQENNATVQIVQAGDAGEALNKAILSKNNPLADVFYGVDNTFLTRALDEGIFEAYASPLLAEIPDEFELDPQNGALPVDYGDVCLNYDVAYFRDNGLQPPQDLQDLAKPEYRSLLVVENPASSSPGLSFLLATIGRFGEDGYLNYWQSLVDNDVLVVSDWDTAYYTEFSASSGKGPRPIVVSYASSPVAEVVFAPTPPSEPPTAAVTAPGTCFRQVEFVGILAGTQNRDLAEKWVDFMLSVPFQEDLPLQMFVYPVNQQAAMPEAYTGFPQAAPSPEQVPPDEIAANREAWIQAWTEAVLR